jgi:hypothetical protein
MTTILGIHLILLGVGGVIKNLEKTLKVNLFASPNLNNTPRVFDTLVGTIPSAPCPFCHPKSNWDQVFPKLS